MTSSSSLGISQITLQFDLSRDIDAAAQDVQAAINAAALDAAAQPALPAGLFQGEPGRRADRHARAHLRHGVAARAERSRRHADGAAPERDHRRRQRHGAGRHQAGGAHPGGSAAARRLRHRARGPRARRSSPPMSPAPKGALDGAHQSYTIAANDQLAAAEAYRTIIIAYRNSAPVLLSDVADVVDGLENTKVGGWYKGEPAVILDIQRQPGANVIETVERIQRELPRLQRIHAGRRARSRWCTTAPTPSAPRCRRAVHPGARGRRSWCWWC